MRLLDLIATGWVEIRAHKMRSFLSFFAITIGIATFFYTLSVLSQRYRQLARSAAVSGVGRLDTHTEHPLTLAQYKDLKYRLPEGSSISFVTPFTTLWGGWSSSTLWYKGQGIIGATIHGIMPSWKDSGFVYHLEGRFINWQDIENQHRVMVLTVFPHEKEERNLWGFSRGDENKLFKLKDFTQHHHLLNQQVILHDQTFTVIGLLHMPAASEDVRFVQDQEHSVSIYIPYTTWYSLYGSEDGSEGTAIRVITGKEDSAQTAGKALYSYLRSQFGPNEKPDIEFFYDKLQERLKEARKSLNNMLFMGIIAMIAGGIGIMNVTMAVVFSRTKEIGIRRALGASRRDILLQFVVEAMLLGLCGAVAGMILGYAAVLHLAEDTRQMTFSWWVVAGSVLIALVTSFLFALYPAWQAAKLKPVEALKHE